MALAPPPIPAAAPTLVSTFEVLFTQQFPRVPPTAAFEGGNDYVIKGYFLTISNISSTQYTFAVGFHCNPPGAGDRGLAATSPFLDGSAPGVQPSFGGATLDGALRVVVPARGTVLLGLLPTVFGTGAPKSDVDVRGWVDLTLPALRGKLPFLYVAQASSPVPVVVTAEQRLTFLTPATGEALTGDAALASPIDFRAVETQGAFALPLATGAAAFAVPPQPGFGIAFPPVEAQPGDLELIETMVQRSPTAMARLFGKPVEEADADRIG